MRGLYVITQAHVHDPETLASQVEAAIDGGASWVQFRHKGADSGRARELADAVLAICQSKHIPVLINDSAALAKETGADGVHLGQTDGSILEARQLLGPKATIGRTCHGSESLMQAAVDEGATYCAFGRLFQSSTKPDAAGLSLDALQCLVAACPIPVVAIGGIDHHNAPRVLETGVAAIAVSGAVFDTPDISAACHRLAQLFKETA